MYPRLVDFNRIRRDLDPADVFLNEHLADIFLTLADRGASGSPLPASQMHMDGTRSGNHSRHKVSPPSGRPASSSRILAARDVVHGRDPRHHGDDAYARMLQRALGGGGGADDGGGEGAAARSAQAHAPAGGGGDGGAGRRVRGAGPVVPGDAVGTVELDREVPVQGSSATMAPTRKGRRKRALNKMKVDSNPRVI